MIIKRVLICLACLIMSHTTQALRPGTALCIVPVADLLAQPIRTFSSSYTRIPYAHKSTNNPHHGNACPRLHQLLFHEIVEVRAIQGNEAEVTVPQVFYETNMGTPQTAYWTLC